jgi:hypothetical protein
MLGLEPSVVESITVLGIPCSTLFTISTLDLLVVITAFVKAMQGN